MSQLNLDSYVLQLYGLPLETTQEELAAWLYSETGLNVGDSSFICLEKAGDLKLKGLVPINRHAIASFLDRLLADRKFKGSAVTVRSAKPTKV